MQGLTRRALLTGATAFAATGAAARATNPSRKAGQALDEIAKASIAQAAVPGLSVAVLQGGHIVYARGFGKASLAPASPVSSQSVFRIGSLSKQFTAAAAIKLAALGKLDLREPISTYLPAFKPLKLLTTLELMHQTAGLHSDEGGEPQGADTRQMTQVELASAIAAQKQPFDFEPGSAWLYSNANYIVLGAVIESVMRQPLARAMRALVFDPLRLPGLAFDSAQAKVARRVSGFTATGETQQPFIKAPDVDPSQAGGAGAMRGTAKELCQWHHALLSLRLFDRAHLDLMLSPGRLRDGRLSSASRFAPEDANYGDTEYACGVLVTGPSDIRPSILHYGSFYGFSAVLQTYRREGLTFAALCNTDLGPQVPFRSIRKAVVDGWTR